MAVNHIKIRPATKKDIHAILELLYDLERPRPKNKLEQTLFEKQIILYLTDSDKKILVAESDSELIGMISIIFISRLNRANPELYIPELVVAKDQRRSGIGKLLMDSCIGMAKKKKCFRLRLESGHQRKEAHKFYTKLYFEQSALTYTKKP